MKLTACMIVKNEEELLPQCLKSIKGVVDEIIIVDTGSTDKTIEIARDYGAIVHEHPWMDNFSFHRNQCFGYADSADWVFVIDADEELMPFQIEIEAFRNRLETLPENIAALVVNVHEVKDGQVTTKWLGNRFFRKSANPRYRRRVHNKVSFEGGVAGTDIILNHYGYSLSPEKMAAKWERTYAMVEKLLEDDINDYEAWYYMAQLYIGANRPQKAIVAGEKCFALLPVMDGKDMQYYANLYFILAMCWLKERDGGWAYSWAEHGLNLYPDDLDLNYVMSRIGYESKNDELMRLHGSKYLNLLAKSAGEKRLVSNKYVNVVKDDKFINRTIYTVNPAYEKQVREWLEV